MLPIGDSWSLRQKPNQSAVKDVLEQVRLSDDQTDRVVRSHPLAPRVVSTTIVSLAASLVPRASIVPDEVNRRLLVTGTEREQKIVAQIIEQIQQESPGVMPELRFYPLNKTTQTAAVALLQTIVPTARVLPADAGRLNIVATPDEHTRVSETLRMLEEGSEPLRRLWSFQRQRYGFQRKHDTLLSSTFADVTFLPTADGSKLMAWVTSAQGTKIRELLTKLETEQPFNDGRTLAVFII